MADMTAAPVPLVLADGSEWRFSPFSDRDITEMDNWVKAQVIVNARNSLSDDMTQRERDEAMNQAHMMALTVTWIGGTGAQIMGTLGGMVRLGWQGVRREHPDVTFERFRERFMTDSLSMGENIAAVSESFAAANRGRSRSPAKPDDPPPSRRTRRQ